MAHKFKYTLKIFLSPVRYVLGYILASLQKCKVKVKLSLCLTKHHTIDILREWSYSSTHSLTSELDAGEWSA